MLESKHIAVFVTGGIASYKALNVVRELIKNRADVQVVMTESATKFVTPLTFATLSKHPVLTDNFVAQSSEDDFIPHIKLARWADLSVVIPATADVIGKMANGIADDLTTTTLMATESPKLVFPAMNTSMWNYPPVQKNLETLVNIGVKVVQPDSGFLAEGETGKGRLADLPEIMKHINNAIDSDDSLAGQDIIVTAGGTKEPIDPVRYIGNRSSGKMGIALAKSAANKGGNVTLITTVKNAELSSNIKVVQVDSAEEMLTELQNRFSKTNVLVMAAAISDFKPVHVSDQKIKKNDNQETYTIELTKNPDILKTVAKDKKEQFVVGFAAETQNLLANAKKKLISKNADVILANDVSQSDAGFNVDTNRITLLSKNLDPQKWELMTKQQVADKFWDYYVAVKK
ncbi:bifunctional phosphopantothenoylcysteine decarboxylase/phosphopantothenate--cysteine ligase CoaBC [Companilactobacillus mishanensis]|uniref:bifunctional phosphopantothenoylcysteine decarboxylase/phosphopantothenate--cysteine ligase CoaBC n=1 Tax=Companilactobacillus mishanensis TaxID=2486008 RepID=UPI001295AC2D|nr:bifunctional phosphopantothenoylcysteine decarboxylase/phosphopantothenate--cysteine ligase CoaBC [Companilactobacillus mishanensis]MQS88842.1 bifunctional phosphopantothenoylcysteine decarboxylase/phosphopantothenate--cysteine ligase CoaBC [Companilactobacillus mishanensis]